MATHSERRVEIPFELVLRVVECLAPSAIVAFPPSSPTAKTIRSFLLVSHLTYPVALRLLYLHCLYIDTSERLDLLVTSLSRYFPDAFKSGSNLGSILGEMRYPILPIVNVVPCLQNLYLSPFKGTALDRRTTDKISKLFWLARKTLRRLVIRIPWRSAPTGPNHSDIRAKLRKTFNDLPGLEEFVAIEDDLSLLSMNEPYSLRALQEVPVWSQWTKLRRLGLYGCDLMSQKHAFLSKLPALESILIHATTYDEKESWDAFFGRLIVQETFPASTSTSISTSVADAASAPSTPVNLQPRQHDIEIIFLYIDFHYGQPTKDSHDYLLDRINWARIWNVEHHLLRSGERNKSRINVSAVAARESWVQSSEWTEMRKDWAQAATVDGGLWDLQRNPRFRQSDLDPDLWLHRSVFGGEEDDTKMHDVNEIYRWSSSIW